MRRLNKSSSRRSARDLVRVMGAWLLPIAVVLPVLSSPASAQTERQERVRIEAERHLRSCGEGVVDTRRRCETNRRNFIEAYVSATAGDYEAQRSVARLLAAAVGTESATTPFSAVIPNRIEACAWRTVLINTDHQDARDEARELRDCGRLTETERLASELRASELFALITSAPPRGDEIPPHDGAGS